MSLRDHLEKVRYFQAVCESQTFRKAATVLHLSQSSLTVSVAKLEEAVGTQLLVRTKRGVRPTEAGALMLKFANDLQFRVEDLEAKLRSPSDGMAGHVRIASYDSIAIYWLPQVLRSLQLQFPNLKFTISIGSSGELVERIKRGESDIAVVVDPQADRSLSVVELFKDSFGFYGNAGKRPGKPSSVVIGMFDAHVSPGKKLSDILSEKGIPTENRLNVESFEIAKSLALQGIGVSILPHLVATFGPEKKQLKRAAGFPPDFGRHRICLVALGKNSGLGKVVATVFGAIEAM